ncbi:MAG TPA: CaiB/BaiF CoA-transferase family protein [Actinomycetota bacterium]
MGPLSGLRVVEIASLAPAPFGCMVLSDLGAEVLRVGRGAPTVLGPGNPLERGRRSIVADLKRARGPELVLRLVEGADVLVEGFRPGVAERLGIGPDECLARNPRLIYARMTGWGQDGPLAGRAGHDIDYIALSGALHPIGPADRPPTPPLNYVGDFGGGGMLLAVGILAALYERERSGRGQVVDAAMVDGSALLGAFLHGLQAAGLWSWERGGNLLDGSAPFYTTYATADGGYVAVGALEPQFYAALLEGLGLAGEDLPPQSDRAAWPAVKERFAGIFATRSRDEWAARFAGTDACVAPVLSPAEAPAHPHNASRGIFVEVNGVTQPAPAPRFSRTPSAAPVSSPEPGEDSDAALAGWGFTAEEIAALRRDGALG